MDDFEYISNDPRTMVNAALPKNSRPDPRGNTDRICNASCKDAGCTKLGRDWLKAALDPFHDKMLDVTGMPDGTNALSLRQIVTQAAVITSSSGPWDVSIVDFPTINSGSKTTYNQVVAYSTGGNGPTGGFQLGASVFQAPTGLSWIQAASGTALDWTSTTPTTGGTLTLPGTYGQSPYRIIAKGFEVYNTSNVLNQGGNCVCWTQNVPNISGASPQLITSASFANPGYFGLCLCPSPPTTIGQAENLPNSVNFLAAQGCYVPGRLNSIDLPTSTATCNQYLYYSSVPTTGPYLVATPIAGGTSTYSNIFSQQSFNLTGAFFTGLPANTTLLVRQRLVLETFPSFGDSLLTNSRPSPAFDPIALEIYTRCLARLPVGVPVDQNALGEWFRSVVNTVKNLPIIRQVVGVPGKIVSGIDTVVAKAGDMVAEGNFNGAAKELSQLAPQGKMAKLMAGKSVTSEGKGRRRSNNQQQRRK